MIEFGETNHVAAATTTVAVEQVFVGVHEKAGFVVGVQRTQSQKAAEADRSRPLPIMCLQILQQRNLLFQFVERDCDSWTACLDWQNTADRAEIPGKDGGCPQKGRPDDSGGQPAPHAEQATLCPSAHARGIRQTGWIFAVRCGLFSRLAGGDPFTGLLSAMEGIVPGGHQPIGQDREGFSARLAESPPHPNAFLLAIMGRTEPSSMANDRVVPANRTSPRQQVQRDHPGSMLSFVSGSAIKRITAGVKARR